MNKDKLVEVYVFPDGTVFTEIPVEKEGDYVVYETSYCSTCGELIEPDYSAPFAYCECGERPWYG